MKNRPSILRPNSRLQVLHIHIHHRLGCVVSIWSQNKKNKIPSLTSTYLSTLSLFSSLPTVCLLPHPAFLLSTFLDTHKSFALTVPCFGGHSSVSSSGLMHCQLFKLSSSTFVMHHTFIFFLFSLKYLHYLKLSHTVSGFLFHYPSLPPTSQEINSPRVGDHPLNNHFTIGDQKSSWCVVGSQYIVET